MATTDFYATKQQGMDYAGVTDDEVIYQDWWRGAVDRLIERFMGQGYKAAPRLFTCVGHNNSLFRLPSRAAVITSVTENREVLPTTDYELETDQRIVERIATNLSYLSQLSAGIWYRNCKYVFSYTEPPIGELPEDWHLTAVICLGAIILFSKKNKEFGIALTAADAGTAGSVSTSASTSFPASLAEELKRTIKTNLRRGSV